MKTIYVTTEELLEDEIKFLKVEISDLQKINKAEREWAFLGRFGLFMFLILLGIRHMLLLLIIIVSFLLWASNRNNIDTKIAESVLRKFGIKNLLIEKLMYKLFFLLKWGLAIFIYYQIFKAIGYYQGFDSLRIGSQTDYPEDPNFYYDRY